MANEEKSTAPRAKVYILDVAVVLLALLLAVCLWQKNNIAYFFEADTTQKAYSVTFVIENVRYDTTKTLAEGTKIYVMTDKGQAELGTLQDAPDVLPRLSTAQTATGAVSVLMPQTDPQRFVDLSGTFVCRGVLRDATLVLPSLSLAVNTTLVVQTEYNNLLLRVVSITENM
ncbi:MAG: hypothetical protein E7639_02940 [Ruminococcaceae bacterium]|nr:hypothetical protein [Oscillospiraceae bacterium]